MRGCAYSSSARVYRGRRPTCVPHPSARDRRWDFRHLDVASALHFSPSLTMRALLALLVLASAASTALANPVSLSASDVTTALQPFSDKIEHCYLDHTANVYGLGKLSVELS